MTNKVKGTCVPVEYLVLGMLENNVYIISDGKATIVVDPTCCQYFRQGYTCSKPN